MRKYLILVILAGNLLFAENNFKWNLNNPPAWIKESIEDINKQIARYSQPNGIVGMSVKDLTTGQSFSLNSKHPFNPASVIKIPVMIEAFHQRAQGKIKFTDELTLEQRHKIPGCGNIQFFQNGSSFSIERLVDLMITDSDNTATFMLIEKLGKHKINSYMRRIGLRKTIIKDPSMLNKMANQHNTSSPEDMLKIMDKMYRGKLVSKKDSEEMLNIMKRQQHKWGIARFLPASTIIANKTGSVDFVRNDVGIIWKNNKPYIITIFSENLPDNHLGSVMVGALSKTVFDKYQPRI